MSKQHKPIQSERAKEIDVKVTMLTTKCGPQGNAFPGTVLNMDEKEAKEHIDGRFVRPFDAELDKKARQFGYIKAAER